MPLTNAGRDLLASLVVGAGGTVLNNANAYIGVGDSSTAFSAAHTDLQAATNKMRKAVDATFPTQVANLLTFKATFATGDANWAWNEWATFNGSTGGTMFNRKVESLGTKTSAQTWAFTCALTVTAA